MNHAFGLREPTLGERISEKLSPSTATTLTEALTGGDLDDIAHKLKVAFGAEDPTLWERIKSVLEPHDSLFNRVKHGLGKRVEVTREEILNAVRSCIRKALC